MSLAFFAAFPFIANSATVQIDSIIIKGNDQTKSQIILRELSINRNTSYDSTELLDVLIPRSIYNLYLINLFNKVEIKTVENGNDRRCNLVVELVEKWYFWPIPFVEYADRNINQWIGNGLDPKRTKYGIYLFKYNFLGLNQTLKINLISGYNQAAGIEYRAPWFLNNPKLGFELKTNWKRQKEVWYKTDQNKVQFFRNLNQELIRQAQNSVLINYRPGLYNWHKPYVSHLYTHVGDTVLTENLNPDFLTSGTQSQHVFRIGYIWNREKRNNKSLATTGYYHWIETSYTWLSKSSSYPMLYAKASVYKPLINKEHPRISVAGLVAGRLMPDLKLPYEQLRSLGYDDIIRGYEFYVIDGTSYALARTEFRFHIFNDRYFHLPLMPLHNYKDMPVESFISFFFDHGYVVNHQTLLNNDLVNSWQYGYGIGVNTLLYWDKVVRFEYSFNRMGGSGIRLNFKQAI